MVDLSYESLEQMDNLILQSSRGVHILFEKGDIIKALKDGRAKKDEDDIEKLKRIQKVLYKFISLKSLDEKSDYLKTLTKSDYSLLIRAYFKIVDNSMMNKSKLRH